MSEEMIICHCSPTLAGIKTGNLFSCSYENRRQLIEEICRLNKKLVPKGLRTLPLRIQNGHALIYFYRPNALARDFADQRTREILEKNDYIPGKINQCIIQLIQRLKSKGDFPHEIGLFLSYPPEDVIGFIDNKARNHKCAGCWKVYGDEKAAGSTFKRYKDCTRIYRMYWKRGKPIERLAVSDGCFHNSIFRKAEAKT